MEEEEEDPVVSISPAEAGPRVSTCHSYRRPPHLQTGTISSGGSRETVGSVVTANRYEWVKERVCGSPDG